MEPVSESTWREALENVIPAPQADTYAKALSKHCVDLQTARDLTASDMQELGILIGHRKLLAQAASQHYAMMQSVRPTGEEEVKVEVDQSLVQSPSGKHESLKVGEEFSVSHRWCAGDTVKWVDMSGSFPTLTEFLSYMGDVLNRAGLRDAHFERAFQDNKPMPFYLSESVGRMFLLRVPDLMNKTGDTLASITNRVLVWWPYVGDTVYTYHRCETSPFAQLENDWGSGKYANTNIVGFFNAAVRAVLRTYRQGAKKLQERSDGYEDEADREKMIWGLTSVSKQAAVYSRCLSAIGDLFNDLREQDSELGQECGIHSDSVQTLIAVCNELNENANSSINMQMALDGYNASVNMKIFTYISVVCQPIGVATGWYGMNFSNMPELAYEDSYFVFIGITLSVVFLLLLWLIYRSLLTTKAK